ncbi:hypothetical protein LTR53_019966, partial [Teratosphaeriaceae sp. CCFEE 6253]
DAEKSGVQTRLRSLEREISAVKAEREGLQAKVAKWRDYDEVKRELEMLRAIEFATVDSSDIDDDADDNRDSHPEHANGNGSPSKSSAGDTLEHLLLTRNKTLSTTLTELR